MILKNQLVVILGGTKGLGRAIGIECAKAGATACLSFKWGSANQTELLKAFERLPAPLIIEADAGDPNALLNLMKQLHKMQHPKIDAIIHCVAFSKLVNHINDIKKNTLDISFKYSSLSFVESLKACHAVFHAYPRYAIAVSSDGSDICHPGYDLVGCSKAVLETLCRYLAVRLKDHNVNVNAIRPGLMETDSLKMTFGEGFIKKIKEENPDAFIDPKAVAKVCVALCSGLMDAVTGQVLNIDKGASLISPLSYFQNRPLKESDIAF